MAPGKDDNDKMVLDAAIVIVPDDFGPVDQIANFDLKSGLLMYLASGRFVQAFSDFDGSAGKAPECRQRLPCPTDEEHPASAAQRDADRKDRAWRILAGIL